MQPDLLDFALRPAESTKRRPKVRQTSKLAVTVKRDSGTLQARAADICHWLSWHQNSTGTFPTAAELAVWVAFQSRQDDAGTARGRFARLDATARKVYISKGISDAQTANMVEPVANGQRVCSVNGRQAMTWRLRSV